MIKLKLNDEIIKDIESGYLKTSKAIKFILENTNGTTEKDIENTATKDIKIDNKNITKAHIQDNYLILEVE